MTSSDEYPARPVVAVGGIVLRDGAVLLVRRGGPPNPGRWSIPGGVLEVGETVEEAVVREFREETGLLVHPLRPVLVTDYIERDPVGSVRWHYVLIDFVCESQEGEPSAASDAVDARYVPLDRLEEYEVTSTSLEAIRASEPTWGRRPHSSEAESSSGRAP